MKRHFHKSLWLAMLWLISIAFATTTNAQQKLVYYWHFNNTNTGLTAAGSPSLIKPIHANWGSLDSTKATISYVPALTVSSSYKTYWDVAAGEASDTFNVKMGVAKGTATGNNELRVRSPSDSMQVVFTLPTTKYKNLTLRFGTERTSSGPQKETYDYSTDGGTTWTIAGMSLPKDTITNSVWNLISISFGGDAAVNNNAKFMFRIKIGSPNSTSTGNIRLDNISLEGDSIGSPAQKLIHYWHFNNFTGLSAAGNVSLITPFHANWSSLDSTKAVCAFVPITTVSSKYATYWDANPGDTLNARRDKKNQTTGVNNALRVRNPTDSMQLLFYLPTTHYQNINLKYELEYSSVGVAASAPGYEILDYSVDSGKTFRQNGLSITTDTMTNGGWTLININAGADPAVNNNPKFVFRIRTTKPNSNTKGNHRYDNFTCEGDTIPAAAVPITKINVPYLQNFDSMANTGLSSTLPYGWYLYETGTNANSTYNTDSGSSNAGNTYSYGHKGSTNRALGSVASGSLLSNYGVYFRNLTGTTVTSVTIGFTVQQWRLGQNNRGNPDSVYANISFSATGLNSTGFGTWFPVAPLSFTSPNYTGTVGLMDGNLPANQKKIKVTIPGLAIPNGAAAWLKWSDPNITGSDDGLAIDDFSLTVFGYKYANIRDVKFPLVSGISDTTKIALLKGIVLGPNYSNAGLNFQIKDSTGNITAINTLKTFNYTPTTGDSVYLYGKIQSANFLTYIALDSVTKIKSGYTTGPAKTVLSISNDTLESGLARIVNMSLASGYKWDTTGNGKNGGFMTTMSNGTTTFNVWISKSSNIWGKPAPKFPCALTGIVLQNGTTATTGYYLWPRSTSDFDTTKLPLYKIRQVRGQNAVTGISDSAGNKHVLYLKGVVNSPSLTTPNLMFSLIDTTGAIIVFSSSVKNYSPVIGDSLLVRGVITQFNGTTEITADSIKTLKKGTWLETPTAVTATNEKTESHIVIFQNAHIVDPLTWVPAGSGFNTNFTNGKDTIQLHIYNNTDLFKQLTAPVGNYNITGVSGQFKSGSPAIGGYQIYPRGSYDMQLITSYGSKPLYKIRQLRGQNAITGVADSLNKGIGFIKGVVHSPSFSATSLQFSLFDSTGAITVFTSKIKYYTPAIGDSLLVHGTLTQFNGVTEYTADSIVKITPGTWLKSPVLVTKLDETNESGLVTIKNVHIIDTTKWLPAGSGFNINIVDNLKDTFVMRITSPIDLFKMKVIKGNFNLTGIETQFKSASPFIGGYQIEPRGVSDIELIPYGVPLYKIRQIRTQNAITGVADSLNKGKGFIKGVVVSPSYSTTYLQFSLVDSTGAITIFTSSVKYYTPSIGDSILAHGLTSQFNGVTEYTTDTIIVLKKGTAIETPSVLTAFDEAHESHLVKVKNVHIIDPTQWTGAGTGFNVNITDGKDTFVMRITNAIDLFKQTAIIGNFNCTGVETQFKSASPFIGGYEIEPRGAFDIELIAVAKFVPLYTIKAVRPQDANGVADSLNKGKGYLKGVVVSPSYSTTYLQFSLVDNTGAITIFTSTVKYYTPVIGDSIMVHGFVTQFNGVTEYTVDTIIKLPKGTAIETPTVLTTFDETHESHLVKVMKVHIIDPTQWTGTGTGFNVSITDGIDTFSMRITSAIDLFKKAPIKGSFNVTGVETQFKSATPFIGGYQIEPRGIFDIQPIPLKLYTISQVKPYDAITGVADSLNLACWLKGVVESPNLSGSSIQFFSIADNTGAITIVAPGPVNGYVAKTGDSVKVRGMVVQINGLTAFGTDSIVKMTGGSAISPVVVTSLDEATESQLVKFNTYQLVDPTKWNITNAINGRFTVDASNGTNTITMAIAQGTDLFANSAVPTGHFDVIGIGSQNDATSPYLQNYLLIPRSIADITHSSGIEPENNLIGNLNIYPNPATNFINVVADFRMTKLELMDLMGNVVVEQMPTSISTIIDINNLKPGIYFIKVLNGNNFIINKIVKQ